MALKLSKALKTTLELRFYMRQTYDLWNDKQRINLDNVKINAI